MRHVNDNTKVEIKKPKVQEPDFSKCYPTNKNPVDKAYIPAEEQITKYRGWGGC